MVVCCVRCALAYGRLETEKQHRKENLAKKRQLKPLQKLASEAQSAFNRYIKARDCGKPCISCSIADNGLHQRHASHYMNTKDNPGLRFNTFNVHTSCQRCNRLMSGNLVRYRQALVKVVGESRVEWFETFDFSSASFSREYLLRIKKIFSRRARLKKRRLK